MLPEVTLDMFICQSLKDNLSIKQLRKEVIVSLCPEPKC